jgi:hypothetical protein
MLRAWNNHKIFVRNRYERYIRETLTKCSSNRGEGGGLGNRQTAGSAALSRGRGGVDQGYDEYIAVAESAKWGVSELGHR